MNSRQYAGADSVGKFVRAENLARFSQMLAAEQDESERKLLSGMIAQVRSEQNAAGDYIRHFVKFSEAEGGKL